jgi:hypothetical protein
MISKKRCFVAIMSSADSKKNIDPQYDGRLDNLEKNIDAILLKVRSASVLNGGFDTIKREIKEIKEAQVRMEYEIKFLVETDARYQKRISDITELMYDPDDGIYKRIANAGVGTEEMQKRLRLLEEKLVTIEQLLTDVNTISHNIKRIAGDDLGELKALVGTKNTVNKLLLVLVTAVAGSVGTFIWGIVERLLK